MYTTSTLIADTTTTATTTTTCKKSLLYKPSYCSLCLKIRCHGIRCIR